MFPSWLSPFPTKTGKNSGSFKNPAGAGNPGVTLHDVQIDLLTDREFGNFAQKTWNRGPANKAPN